MKPLHTVFILGRALALALLVLSSAALRGADSLTLIADQRSEYRIVIPGNAFESVREAAGELQRVCEIATGVRLPIVSTLEPGVPAIVIGHHPAAAAIDLEGLPHDGFRLKIEAGRIYLKGVDTDARDPKDASAWDITRRDPVQFYNIYRWKRSLSAGSYNATIEFLKRYLGARWYLPGPLGEEIKPLASVALPASLDEKIKPYFEKRDFDLSDIEVSELKKPDYDWAAMRDTTRWARRLRHTNNNVLANAHSWRHWIPADAISNQDIAKTIGLKPYGKTHPEFFALVAGQRQTRYTSHEQHGGQLCMSNPELIETYANNIIAYGKKRPEIRMFGLGQNDGGMNCECEACRAWDPPGRVMDSAFPHLTDRYMRFNNAVIERVLRELPDAEFNTMAYHENGVAPVGQTAHPRLHLTAYNNYLPYLYNLAKERREVEDSFAAWKSKTSNMYFGTFFWAYGNYSLPWSSPAVYRWFVDFMVSSGHRGLIIQHHEPVRFAAGAVGPDVWMLSELLWNPRLDAEALQQEWYDGAFGPQVGAILRRYYTVIDEAMAAEIARRPQFMKQRAESQKQINLVVYARVRAQCRALIDEAVAAAAGMPERYRWRVDRVARTWQLAEHTLDAVDAFRVSRIKPSEETQTAAIAAGQRFEKFYLDPTNLYSVSPWSVRVSNQQARMTILTEVPKNPLPGLTLRQTTSPAPKIDGDPGDAFWREAANEATVPAFLENLKGGPAPAGAGTTLTAAYDAAGLYLLFQASEPDMAGLRANDDPLNLWLGDAFELYISPSGGSGGFLQFQVNPNGVSKAYAHRGDTGVDARWNPSWERAAQKTAGGWTVELFLPWATLEVEGPPAAGELWFANFYRVRRVGELALYAWSPTGGRFAQPEKFGRLLFLEKR